MLRCVQMERRVNEVVDYYDIKNHSSGGQKGGRHGRVPPDLMRRFSRIIREVIFIELVLCTFVFLIAQCILASCSKLYKSGQLRTVNDLNAWYQPNGSYSRT